MSERTKEMMAARVDAALVSFMLEKGRKPQFIRMCYGTFEYRWDDMVKRDQFGQWMWRGILISLRSGIPIGEVECV